jgi:Cd2+/Zn2+-exporting ATPase
MVFSQIVRLVEEAQANKAPVERVANRYAKWFAPVIVLIAIATQLYTNNIIATVAVIVISCPCALTLATPIAVVASMGNASKNGILVRDGPSLEQIGKIDIVIVDKTGTLTMGSPIVVEVKGLDGNSIEEVVELAAVAEKFSEHSIAKAIMQKAEDLGLNVNDPDNFELRMGYGVIAIYDNKRIIVGNKRLLEENDILFKESLRNSLTNQEINGRTSVIIAVDSKPIGFISIADTLRKGVISSIKEMRKNGVKKVIMLTGDNRHIAEMIAKQAFIDETHSELLPENKVEYIKSYQRQGYKVAMIGDGINDAPALTQADVGITMGITGTDVAKETAGIILITDDLSKVSKIMDLSQSTLNVIKQNVMFALAVNFLGILFSTQGFINPIIASIIHESSALIVVFNSLRLAMKKL